MSDFVPVEFPSTRPRRIPTGYVRGGPDECWPWVGQINAKKGYGQVSVNRRTRQAHRLIYEQLVGPVPRGLTLDHLCRNRACVNPAHLEPVTNKENVLRGNGITARQAQQTHCKRGHPLSGKNLYITKPGSRCCRTCQKAKHDEWRDKNRDYVREQGRLQMRKWRAKQREVTGSPESENP